jgi:peptide/nickel transport system substrate-binding protein
VTPPESSKLSDEGLSRRDLVRMAVGAAGIAAIGPAGNILAQSSGGTPEASPAHPRGGSVTIAQAGDPDSLDPQFSSAGVAFTVYSNIFDTLVGFKADFTYEGILAESWEISGDELEYTFHLRRGIAFHDGSAFDANAVKFSFDRITDPAANSPNRGQLSALKQTLVVDPLTVKFVLSEPFAPFLSSLVATWTGAILPPAAVQKTGADFGKNPIGTGPWKFKEWVRGSTITLVRNENYRNFHSYAENKGAPYLGQIVFTNIPESSTQVAALETNEVQIVLSLPPVEVDRIKADPAYQVIIPTSSISIQYIEFAMVKPAGDYGAQWAPPFDDIRVRQAVGYALDVDTIIAKVLFGLAIRNYGPIPTGMFAYRPDIEQYGFHFDQNKAKVLLDQAGWTNAGGDTRTKNGTKLDLLMWTWNLAPNDKIVQVIQNQLAAVGMSVKVQVLEVGTFLSTLVGGPENFDMSAWGAYDPSMLKEWLSANQPISSYRDQSFVELVDKASQVSDLTERTNLYFEAQKKLLSDAAMIPLFSSVSATGVRSAKGFKIAPTAGGVYEDVYLEG